MISLKIKSKIWFDSNQMNSSVGHSLKFWFSFQMNICHDGKQNQFQKIFTHKISRGFGKAQNKKRTKKTWCNAAFKHIWLWIFFFFWFIKKWTIFLKIEFFFPSSFQNRLVEFNCKFSFFLIIHRSFRFCINFSFSLFFHFVSRVFLMKKNLFHFKFGKQLVLGMMRIFVFFFSIKKRIILMFFNVPSMCIKRFIQHYIMSDARKCLIWKQWDIHLRTLRLWTKKELWT